MKKLLLLLLISIFSCTIAINYSYAVTNISIGGTAGNESSNVKKNTKLTEFNENNRFIDISTGGEKGIFNTLVRFARDLKNLFYIIATIYFLIISLRLILSSNTEEELGKFKKGIIWITIGLIVMQIAFAFTKIMFDQGVSASLGASLIENLIWPLVLLIQTLASIFFIAMAIYAFYRLVTANGNEEAVKSGKITILYALIGFVLVRLARSIVEAFYGKIDTCASLGLVVVDTGTLCNRVDVSEGVSIIINVLNWMNGFVILIVLIMIIYAGFQILLSGGDEEKVNKGKNAVAYIAVGLAILVMNYLILTLFLLPNTPTGTL